jgi:hypothetical protein
VLFDVAIVAAVLAAQRVFRAEELRGTILLGELGLDGRLRPIRGILPATLAAQQAGFTRVIVPLRQAEKLPNCLSWEHNLRVAKPWKCHLGLHDWELWENQETHAHYQVCRRCDAERDSRRPSWSPDSGDTGPLSKPGAY